MLLLDGAPNGSLNGCPCDIMVEEGVGVGRPRVVQGSAGLDKIDGPDFPLLIGELVHLVGFFGLRQDVLLEQPDLIGCRGEVDEGLLDFQGDSVGQVSRLLPEGPKASASAISPLAGCQKKSGSSRDRVTSQLSSSPTILCLEAPTSKSGRYDVNPCFFRRFSL